MAVTEIASNGPWPGAPWLPSASSTCTLPSPTAERFSRAVSTSSGWRSTVITDRHSRDSTAVAYPDPLPISRTRSDPDSCSASVITATIHGMDIVWSAAMGTDQSA